MPLRSLPIPPGLFVLCALSLPAFTQEPDEKAIRGAVTFYASFDEEVKGDFGGGQLTFDTRSNHPTEKGAFVVDRGFSDKAFRIAKNKGIAGGALEAVDVLPKNGRIFVPAKGNIALKKDGWGGSVSTWCKTDPDKMLKTRFCDPIQITHKGAHDGALWFDFNDAKPRDLRHGAFPMIPEGKKGIPESDPNAPLVRVPKVGWKADDWHHVVLTWENLDTGKANAVTSLYIDGKLIGQVKGKAITMGWEIEKVGIYTAINYLGLLDELAIFNRALKPEEVTALFKKPGLLAGLKKKPEKKPQLPTRLPATKGDPPAAPKFPFDAESAARHQRDYAKWLGVPVEATNDLGMEFVFVPPGTFLMGTPEDEPGHKGAEYAEGPRHTVTLTKPFYLGKHEVTVGQFRAFVDATKYKTDGEKTGGGHAHDAKAVWQHRPGTNWLKPGFAGLFELKDNQPVVHVSHTDAGEFCKWLGSRKSVAGAYTLPTEAQWEWACRAGTASRYWWGEEEDTTGTVANVGDKTLKKVHPDWPRVTMPMTDGFAFVAPVGTYKANAFGLHDMIGNVWEFCSTRFGPYPKDAVTDPGDIDPKRGFAVRGGGWSNIPKDVRSGGRNADPPHFCHSNLGFRVAVMLK
ncbi:MAG: SUMF1/EgtB/PvdO family nonheme iron enzyme [Planctomycetia bacterium]|nr:SUMF1/EgtB/PvdO family nonheme iron enzyme [Planctomycetia bacterium]